MSEPPPSALFEQLCGERLSAVTFVQDHLQLWFDGPGINVANPLTVLTGQTAVGSWQPGFREVLRGCLRNGTLRWIRAILTELAEFPEFTECLSILLKPDIPGSVNSAKFC